jgi:microcystin degradation protein MlrC
VGAEKRGWQLCPCLYAGAVPSGTVEDRAYEVIASQLIRDLEACSLVDAVLLSLHGAMATETGDDSEGDLLERVAAVVGSDVPILAVIDYHANVTDRMVEHVDALIGFDTYPHEDMYERGLEAVELLDGIMRDGRRRTTVHRKLDLTTTAQVQYTQADPMRPIMEETHRLESMLGVQLTVAPGFSYNDVSCQGMSVIGSGHDPAVVSEAVGSIVSVIERRRDRFVWDALPVDEAVRRAATSDRPPVVLVDSADNTGGGSPGDGTSILAAWLRAGLEDLVITLADPEAVRIAVEAGVGATIDVTLGGKTDRLHGDPVSVTAYVKSIGDGRYRHEGTWNRGYISELGLTVMLEVGGNFVQVTERKAMPFDAQYLLSTGVNPVYHRALVVKSAIAWRAAFGDIAGEIIEVDAPGICTGRLSRVRELQVARRRSVLATS